jgi:hypothetical protein
MAGMFRVLTHANLSLVNLQGVASHHAAVTKDDRTSLLDTDDAESQRHGAGGRSSAPAVEKPATAQEINESAAYLPAATRHG